MTKKLSKKDQGTKFDLMCYRVPLIKFDDIDRDDLLVQGWHLATNKDAWRLQSSGKPSRQATRWVMERKLGRELLSTERVFAIDGNALNVKRDNLELIDSVSAASKRIHQRLGNVLGGKRAAAKAKLEAVASAKSVAHEQSVTIGKNTFKFTIFVEIEEA